MVIVSVCCFARGRDGTEELFVCDAQLLLCMHLFIYKLFVAVCASRRCYYGRRRRRSRSWVGHSCLGASGGERRWSVARYAVPFGPLFTCDRAVNSERWRDRPTASASASTYPGCNVRHLLHDLLELGRLLGLLLFLQGDLLTELPRVRHFCLLYICVAKESVRGHTTSYYMYSTFQGHRSPVRQDAAVHLSRRETRSRLQIISRGCSCSQTFH